MTTPERPATLSVRVGAEIRANRARLRISQTELADILGESHYWVGDRERGRVPIDLDELERITDALNQVANERGAAHIRLSDLIPRDINEHDTYELVLPARAFSRERDAPGGQIRAEHRPKPTSPRPHPRPKPRVQHVA